MLLKTWRKTFERAPSPSILNDDASFQIGKSTKTDVDSATNYCVDAESTVATPVEDFSSFLADGYKGQFYRADNKLIIGWIASDSGIKLSPDSLIVRIDGPELLFCTVNAISAFDLELEYAYDNCLFFEVISVDKIDITVIENAPGAALYLVEDSGTSNSSNKVKLLASKVCQLNGDIFNTNPLMLPDSTVSMIDWTIDHDERCGLRLDRFTCDEKDIQCLNKWSQNQNKTVLSITDTSKRLRVPAAYSRITLTDLSSKQLPIILACPLTPVCKFETEELEVVMRVRSDRPTWMICRLKRNGVTISTVKSLINYKWSNIRRTLPGSNLTPLFKSVNYHLEIELKHEGRGFIDFAACAIGLSPRLTQVLLPAENMDVAKDALDKLGTTSSRNFIRNGEFSSWSNGVTFKTFKPRQQTADGWRFECRENQVDNVVLQLVNVNEKWQREMHSKNSFGLSVKTKEFNGPMRLVTVLDHSLLDATAAKLSIAFSVNEGCSPVQFLRRIYILGRSIGKEEILHIIARKPRVHDHTTFVYDIDEPTMIKLRRTIGVYSSLLFVIEYEMNSEIVISSAVLNQALSTEEKQEKNAAFSLTELRFEDPSISTQSMILNGLETWCGGVVKVENFGRNEKTLASDIFITSSKPMVPSWNRPTRHYPSVDIVVPIFNALSALKDCLTSLIRETTIPYTLICVDDASSLETREYLTEFSDRFPHVRLVTNLENIGYTRNVNRGIENSAADWVCILNSDCIVTTNWLERLLDVAISSSKTGIVSPLSNAASYQSIPRIRNNDSEWSFNPLPANMQPNDMANLVWEHSLSAHPRAGVANGFCQLIRRDMLDSIGWLDEAAFPRGFGEENDLCARAVKSGWEIRIADDTYVYHVKSQSFGHTERKRLSKDGSSALKDKHPDVDWKIITTELENEHSLVELRKRLISSGI